MRTTRLTALASFLLLCGCAGNSDNLYAKSQEANRNCWLVKATMGPESMINCQLNEQRKVWESNFPMGLAAYDEAAEITRELYAAHAAGTISDADYAARFNRVKIALHDYYLAHNAEQRVAQQEQNKETADGLQALFQGAASGVAVYEGAKYPAGVPTPHIDPSNIKVPETTTCEWESSGLPGMKSQLVCRTR